MAGSRAAAVRFACIVLGGVPVVAGPGDEIAAGAGGHGHLRASHADREQVIGTLKAAFVQGRFTKDEFDQRVSQAFASRTYAELAAVTADLPAGLAAARPPAPARGSVNKKKKAAAALSCATLAYAALMAALPPIPDESPLKYPSLLVMFALFGAITTGWLALLHAWLDERAGRKSAHGLPPGGSSTASRRPAPAGPDRQIPPAPDRPRHTAEAAPIRRALLPGSRPQVTTGYLTHPA